MHRLVALSILLAWTPLVLVLFRAIGPQKAAIFAVFAGFLLLPGGGDWKAFDCLMLEKRTMPGIALALAVLILDFKALRPARPRWYDLPMALFVATPLVGTAIRGGRDWVGGIDQAWIHLWEWAAPYAVGRLYLARGDGRRRLAQGMIIAGLLYVPLVAFEAVAGPSYYLKGLAYGQGPQMHMVERLGGWRPEALVGTGIELACWMALAAVLACWMSACRDRWKVAWGAAPVLVLATLACRGVYGYLTLALGLASGSLTLATGRRWFLAALLLVPPAYCAARASGLWDGQVLVKIADPSGRASTISTRLYLEDTLIRSTQEKGRAFGGGGRYPQWEADGWWVKTLAGGGVVGLAAYLAAFGLPAAIALLRRPARSVEMGLALVIVLHLVDSLHNASIIPTTLLGGALLGGPPVARRDDQGGAAGTVRYRIR